MEKSKEQSKDLMVLASALANRFAMASKLGQQYSGDRDIYEALGYKTNITFDDYASRYSRQDIAKAIINRPIQYTWKGPLILLEGQEEEDTEFEKAWRKLERELKLKDTFIRLDKLSCIGKYGVLLLGFDDVSKTEDFAQPIKQGKRKLLYITPLSEGAAAFNTYVNDTKNPRYGKIETYSVTLQKPGDMGSNTITVHHTRILHIAGELLESDLEGVPVLEAVFNRLMDLEKLTGGSAEMFWRGARPGYQGIVDPDATLTAGVEEDLQDQIDEYEHNLRRILVNEGVKFESLTSQVSDPTEHVDVQLQMISAVTGIPKRILVGSERGELSSAQDEVGWLNLIQGRREEYAENKIIRPFVELMQKHGILPALSSESFSVDWSDLFAPSEKEKAEVGRIRATALREYGSNPMMEMIVPPDAFFEFFLGLKGDQILQIREMAGKAIDEEMRAALLNPPTDPIEEENNV